MKTHLITAVKFLILMTLLTGLVYPVFITGIAQILFPYKANGSMIMRDRKIIGSELLGQKFDSVGYFHSRPSAIEYNPVPSGASNLGPVSSKLKKQVSDRRKAWVLLNQTADSAAIPEEMLSASGSGLDPHISERAALLQTKRVASSRHFSSSQEKQLTGIIKRLTEKPQFGLLGEKRVNILMLNMMLDEIHQ